MLPTLSPRDARAALDCGARLVDLRGADEFARERIPGAVNLPLDRIATLPHDHPVIFHCKSGMRTAANAGALAAAAAGAPAYILEGGSMPGAPPGRRRSSIARSRWRSCGRCRSPRAFWS